MVVDWLVDWLAVGLASGRVERETPDNDGYLGTVRFVVSNSFFLQKKERKKGRKEKERKEVIRIRSHASLYYHTDRLRR